MIAFDTNIWVRILTNDDPVQSEQALQLLENASDLFLPKTVLLELEWVLRSVYKISKETIQDAMHKMLGLPALSVETADQVKAALDLYAAGMDFADALHLSSCGDLEFFYSFDQTFVKSGLQHGLPVTGPMR